MYETTGITPSFLCVFGTRRVYAHRKERTREREKDSFFVVMRARETKNDLTQWEREREKEMIILLSRNAVTQKERISPVSGFCRASDRTQIPGMIAFSMPNKKEFWIPPGQIHNHLSCAKSAPGKIKNNLQLSQFGKFMRLSLTLIALTPFVCTQAF